MEPLLLLLVLATGFFAGTVAGLFGVGGGMVMVPALTLGLAYDFFTAKAASLLVIAASTAVGVEGHRRSGNVEARLGLVLAGSGIAGAVAAVAIAEGVAEQWLRVAFGLLLIAAAWRLGFEVRPRARLDPTAVYRIAPILGVSAGLAAGFFGIGGGLVMVPVLVLLGIRIHVAVGTSLLAVLVNAIASTGAHVYYGHLPGILEVGIPLAAGALVGNWVGARTAVRTRARPLQRAFAVLLAAVGAYMTFDALA